MKYRLHISFELPGPVDPKKVASIISKIFKTTQKLVDGEVSFSVPETKVELSRVSVVIQSENKPPRADELRIRLPELKGLEIADGSIN